MALIGARWSFFRPAATTFFIFILAFVLVDADERSKQHGTEDLDSSYLMKVARFLRKYDFSGYPHVWPEMEFGWKIVVGTIIGCFGAAFGSVGGVGGGGIFIPMLMLIIGFDAKSSAALSKCMITGAAVSTVYHNMKLRHPTLDIPIFEYDLVLLIFPYLLLGISIGVTFSVIFPDWVITALLIILFLGTAVKAFFKGIDTWKQETILKEDAAKRLHPTDANLEVDYKPLLGGASNNSEKTAKEKQFNVLRNIRWMELGLVVFVWIGFLILQIAKSYTTTCSTAFWVLNLLQIPVSVSVSLYLAIGLYKGTRKVQSMGETMNWPVRKLLAFCICGMVAGTIGGLLGIGGGFVTGPLYVEIGIHPLVSSATATLGMTFSASMSVVEYYLLDRFPIPYALYFIAVSIVAAFVGQHIITKLITITGRASLIIFVLSFTIFISGISLGGVGISNMIGKIERGESMGFEDLCNNEAARRSESSGTEDGEVEYKSLPSGPGKEDNQEKEVTILENVCWKELGLLVFVWLAFLGLQISKEYTSTCSTGYWILNLSQIPVSVGVSLYEAVSLYKGRRIIASKGEDGKSFTVLQLLTYCLFGVLAGVVGGLLGLGGGFIMGPLFLELGVPPQVSSATATFAMTFSSSMSVVEYYLLKRFPVPFAAYFVGVATLAAFVGQHIVRRLIILCGRASLIIFILAFTIFVSAISLGGVGISNMIGKISRHEYMGFENLCKYGA